MEGTDFSGHFGDTGWKSRLWEKALPGLRYVTQARGKWSEWIQQSGTSERGCGFNILPAGAPPARCVPG